MNDGPRMAATWTPPSGPTRISGRWSQLAALSAALAPWRKARAVHDPGKTVLDVALALALGGDCLADVTLLRVEPALFGLVASDPTVSRLVDALAAAGPTALTAIRAARSLARQRVWSLACRAGWPPFRVSSM